MYAIQKLLISLDMSAMDDCLIPYSLKVASITEVEEVIFMHVLKDKSSQAKKKKAAIEHKIESFTHSLHSNTKIRIELLKGDPLNEMMNLAKKEEIDLLVVGRKNIVEGTGETSRKLSRRALCSILRVPENAKPEFKKILIPIDFSEYSQLALTRALEFAQKEKNVEIICLNIYELPKGYLQSGKTLDEFAEIMEENAKKRYQYFIRDFETKGVHIKAKFQLDKNNVKAKIISNIALVEGADLIMMGSRGRTNMAAALLGSTTEKLLLHNLTIPMLILKKKEQNLGFFNALLKI